MLFPILILVKPLAVKVYLALKAIYSEISRYTKMLYKVTGVNRNWIILNNRPIMDALELVKEIVFSKRNFIFYCNFIQYNLIKIINTN